jgi:hypothetical protein
MTFSSAAIADAAGFDYVSLDADIRDIAMAAADRIKQRMRGAIIDIGVDLLHVKERLPHGQFGKWLLAEFTMTERTAQNYMSAAALASKSETVSVLRPKTIYLLAAPSTPEPTRQAIIDRLEAGEALPDDKIVDIVGEARFQKRVKAREVARRRRRGPPRSPAQIAAAARRAEKKIAQAEEQLRREEAAAATAASLIIDAVGDRAPQLAALLTPRAAHHLEFELRLLLRKIVQIAPSELEAADRG